jgi:hypothetical protein
MSDFTVSPPSALTCLGLFSSRNRNTCHIYRPFPIGSAFFQYLYIRESSGQNGLHPGFSGDSACPAFRNCFRVAAILYRHFAKRINVAYHKSPAFSEHPVKFAPDCGLVGGVIDGAVRDGQIDRFFSKRENIECGLQERDIPDAEFLGILARFIKHAIRNIDTVHKSGRTDRLGKTKYIVAPSAPQIEADLAGFRVASPHRPTAGKAAGAFSQTAVSFVDRLQGVIFHRKAPLNFVFMPLKRLNQYFYTLPNDSHFLLCDLGSQELFAIILELVYSPFLFNPFLREEKENGSTVIRVAFAYKMALPDKILHNTASP